MGTSLLLRLERFNPIFVLRGPLFLSFVKMHLDGPQLGKLNSEPPNSLYQHAVFFQWTFLVL